MLPDTLRVPSTYVLDPLSIKKPVFLVVALPVPTANITSEVLFLILSFALNLPKNTDPNESVFAK